jgi:hypothetical protein
MARLLVRTAGLRGAEPGRRPGVSLRVALVLLTAPLIWIGAVDTGAARADGPSLFIASPENGSTLRDPMPSFEGNTSDGFDPFSPEEFDPVKVHIEGPGGVVLPEPEATSAEGGLWSAAVTRPLADGRYVAVAEQTKTRAWSELTGEGSPVTGKSTVQFTIDTTPPHVTLTAPANESSTGGTSVTASGAAGTASGDLPSVSVELFAGSSAGSQPQETLVVGATSTWSATFEGLAPGTYTVQATQNDAVGNTGTSPPATFTVTPPPAPPPPASPAASFVWIPSAPVVGESVSLVSNSTDLASPITGFAWALSPTAPFSPGGSLLTTSFSTPGAHAVRLRVTDAAGGASTTTETVPVKALPSVPMSPFPIVRIAGSLTSRGARIKLLTVQAPLSALVTIRCRGHGCRTKSESRSAIVSSKSKQKPGAVLLSFGRFERSYGARAELEISIVKAGQIGKYTTLVIRKHKAPLRTDACLLAIGGKPFPCTSS